MYKNKGRCNKSFKLRDVGDIVGLDMILISLLLECIPVTHKLVQSRLSYKWVLGFGFVSQSSGSVGWAIRPNSQQKIFLVFSLKRCFEIYFCIFRSVLYFKLSINIFILIIENKRQKIYI